MKRIAITGVSGYIGGRLLSRLDKVTSVDRVVGIDIRPPTHESAKLSFYCQDILKPLDEIFVENEVDTAVHLTFVLKPTHDKKSVQQIDIGGTSNFLQACGLAQVNHILYLSSHTVYGAYPDNNQPLGEDSLLHPLPGFQYSLDKAESERMFMDFAVSHRNACLTILRSCPVIGPNADKSVVTSMFQPIMIGIAGYDPPMQFVHEDDLIGLILLLLLERKKHGIFNVAGDAEIRYSEVAKLSGRKMLTLPGKLLSPLMGLLWTLRLQRESPASGLEFIKYHPVVSTQRLKNETGFQFRHSSKDALMSYVITERQHKTMKKASLNPKKTKRGGKHCA